MPSPLKSIVNWMLYERLHRYPVLRDNYPPKQAIKMLNVYEKKERQSRSLFLKCFIFCAYMLMVVIPTVLLFYTVSSGNSLSPAAHLIMGIPVILYFLSLIFVTERTKRVVAAELEDSQTVNCPNCGLTVDKKPSLPCPECGYYQRR